MLYNRKLLLLLILFILVAPVLTAQDQGQPSVTSQSFDHHIPASMATSDSGPAKNIILLIGDGMGLTQISSAFYYKDSLPHYARFNNIGLMKTSSTVRITDSAAGATAFSAGEKTYNGAIAVNTDTVAVPTILEMLSKEGWKTGLLSTSSITHATPASFYAHVKSRGMQEEIATQLTTSDVDFIAGGGYGYFADSVRSDGENLLKTMQSKGYSVNISHLDETISSKSKYACLLGRSELPSVLNGRGDFLPKATSMALEYLSEGDNFFLMVEGSMIDWGGHANDADFLVSEMLDFDDVIGRALDFAEKDGNTLVIVTADHETGGYTLSSGENYDQIKGTFSTGGHSTALIPVAAYGPGSELFRGVYENTEIFHKMMQALASPETN